MSSLTQTPSATQDLRVTRSRRNVAWAAIGALIVIVVFAMLPYIVYSGTTTILTQAFIILTLASMWNLLAGYAGLVSVGMQVFVGLGAYGVLIASMNGINPFAGVIPAALFAVLCALPMWWLVSRLRTGYFAIATWVLATVVMLVFEDIKQTGGNASTAVQGFAGFSPTLLTADTYWISLVAAVLAVGGTYFVLRSRLGLMLTAIRDNEVAARSSGVKVGRARMVVFLIAAFGCGFGGAVLAIQQLTVQPTADFSVQWTAEMAFAVIIGGLGTIEGPIIGTIVYMVLQQTLQSYNEWYLIALGLVAIAAALFTRRGVWGLVDDRFNLRLFPTGYHLWAPGETRRGNRAARKQKAAA
jgi:branched-chain amino acid transport system permease protein